MNNNITADGRKKFENTSEFKRRVLDIKKELADQYAPLLRREKNWIKCWLIHLKRYLEVRKKIATLSSERNLHLFKNHTDV